MHKIINPIHCSVAHVAHIWHIDRYQAKQMHIPKDKFIDSLTGTHTHSKTNMNGCCLPKAHTPFCKMMVCNLLQRSKNYFQISGMERLADGLQSKTTAQHAE